MPTVIPTLSARPRVAVVVLNYDGWDDTLECLDSLLGLTPSDHHLVLCDNGSREPAVERVNDWASDRGLAVERYGEADRPRLGGPRTLHVLRVSENRGFAPGINAGLRFVLRDPSVTHAWLLNNDVVVEPEALDALLERLAERPEAGLCGSSVYFYGDRERAHAFGGARYFAPLGLAMHIGRLRGRRRELEPERVEAAMDYVFGASMLATRPFLEAVGPLFEGYFLYGEEHDWALRARGRFGLAYAPRSLVYHKAGVTAGSSRSSSQRSASSEYYLVRSRVLLARRFHPWWVPTVAAFAALGAARSWITGRRELASADVRALRDGLRASVEGPEGW